MLALSEEAKAVWKPRRKTTSYQRRWRTLAAKLAARNDARRYNGGVSRRGAGKQA